MSLSRIVFFVAGVLSLSAIAFAILPAPIDPLAVRLAPDPDTQRTSKRVAIKALDYGALLVPEGLAINDTGQVYVGTLDGKIYRSLATSRSQAWELWANVGGYPIGLAFDTQNNNLWAANYGVGLQQVQSDGTWANAVVAHEGQAMGFVDDVVVGKNGVVYFTEASTKFSPVNYEQSEPFILWEVLEGRPHGRLLAYSPGNNEVEVLIPQSFFPSGIALNDEQTAIYYVEVTHARLMRFWLKGARAGTTDTVATNLPGIPDDVVIDARDHAWVSLVSHRDELLDKWVQPYPWIKSLISKLPNAWLLALQDIEPSGSLLKINLHTGAQCQIHFDRPFAPANIELAGEKLLMATLLGSEVWELSVPATYECN